jgi:hypothetical protein
MYPNPLITSSLIFPTNDMLCAFSEWSEAARLILPCPSCFAATLAEQLGPQVLALSSAPRCRASLQLIIKSHTFLALLGMAETLFLTHLSKFLTRQAIKLCV